MSSNQPYNYKIIFFSHNKSASAATSAKFQYCRSSFDGAIACNMNNHLVVGVDTSITSTKCLAHHHGKKWRLPWSSPLAPVAMPHHLPNLKSLTLAIPIMKQSSSNRIKGYIIHLVLPFFLLSSIFFSHRFQTKG